jgi:hypothetical protein
MQSKCSKKNTNLPHLLPVARCEKANLVPNKQTLLLTFASNCKRGSKVGEGTKHKAREANGKEVIT